MMEATIEILKKKIEVLSPDLLEALSKILDKVETQVLADIPQFQMDEVSYRIQFHSENPATKLDFFDNVAELEQICA
ncbi:hypothetical protein [Chryseobacterium caseinilyticum]|uniref:Uncharacterized protein n=2 Tax=Chryseobacterium TaxID=59732 RepID=A0ABR8ZFT3_9FLAO|nr:hypothetical protein [Chryseobacterium caseinilyticum]MBD8084159.1 hypothetical protein [Chryseobacterium caseinilyticum]